MSRSDSLICEFVFKLSFWRLRILIYCSTCNTRTGSFSLTDNWIWMWSAEACSVSNFSSHLSRNLTVAGAEELCWSVLTWDYARQLSQTTSIGDWYAVNLKFRNHCWKDLKQGLALRAVICLWHNLCYKDCVSTGNKSLKLQIYYWRLFYWAWSSHYCRVLELLSRFSRSGNPGWGGRIRPPLPKPSS